MSAVQPNIQRCGNWRENVTHNEEKENNQRGPRNNCFQWIVDKDIKAVVTIVSHMFK